MTKLPLTVFSYNLVEGSLFGLHARDASVATNSSSLLFRAAWNAVVTPFDAFNLSSPNKTTVTSGKDRQVDVPLVIALSIAIVAPIVGMLVLLRRCTRARIVHSIDVLKMETEQINLQVFRANELLVGLQDGSRQQTVILLE